MDYLKEIRKVIKEFCQNVPAEGFEINYLENAKELYELYGEALVKLEKGEDKTNLKEIYEKAKSL